MKVNYKNLLLSSPHLQIIPHPRTFRRILNRSKYTVIFLAATVGTKIASFLDRFAIIQTFFTAAAIVMGRNANGLNGWKKKDWSTLREFEEG